MGLFLAIHSASTRLDANPLRHSGNLLRSPIVTWPLINLVWVSLCSVFFSARGTHRVYHDMCSGSGVGSLVGGGQLGVGVHF